MSIQIFSDLHLESPKAYDVFEITPRGLYLALIGDIGNVEKHQDDFFFFLETQLRRFQAVLFVPGNHEAYYSSWSRTLDLLRKFEKDTRADNTLGEFVLLDRGVFHIPDTQTAILGCSLFSHVPPENEDYVSLGLNDFYHIQGWSVAQHNEAHKRDLKWLNEQVKALDTSDTEIIILTHWSPTRDPRSMDPKHANSPIVSAFVTDLSKETCFLSRNVKLWAFGHTHFNCDLKSNRGESIEPLRLLTNQRGYYFAQADRFVEDLVV